MRAWMRAGHNLDMVLYITGQVTALLPHSPALPASPLGLCAPFAARGGSDGGGRPLRHARGACRGRRHRDPRAERRRPGHADGWLLDPLSTRRDELVRPRLRPLVSAHRPAAFVAMRGRLLRRCSGCAGCTGTATAWRCTAPTPNGSTWQSMTPGTPTRPAYLSSTSPAFRASAVRPASQPDLSSARRARAF